MNVEDFSFGYLKKLTNILGNLDIASVSKIVTLLESTIEKNSRVYLLGNGGSAATASHMVNDFGGGLNRRDIKRFNFVNLTDNVATCSALANDVGYENIFYFQLKGLLTPHDVIFAISCSGNSPNIIKAVEYAKSNKTKVIGVTGFDGGRLAKISDVNFHVETPNGEYGLVEDVHMILNHMIYSYYLHLAGV